MPEASPDVVVRGIAALRAVLTTVVAGVLALGVMALALVLLVGPDSGLLWPGVSVLLVGQAVGLVAAALAGWALRQVLVGQDPARARATLARRLRPTAIALVTACLATAAGWGITHAGALVPALVCAVVAAQLAVVLEVLRRRLAD